MKRLFILLIISIIGFNAIAQTDQFPTINTSETTMAIPMGAPGTRIYAPDGARVVCDSFLVYTIDGAVQPTAADWTIRTNGGHQSAADTNSATALLARTLKAYQTMNFTSLAACYDTESATELNQLLKVDSIKMKYLMAMANINYMDLQVAFHHNGYTYLFVKIFYYDGTNSLMLYLAKQENNQWKLASAEDKFGLSYNLLSYLTNNQPNTLIPSNDLKEIIAGTKTCPCQK